MQSDKGPQRLQVTAFDPRFSDSAVQIDGPFAWRRVPQAPQRSTFHASTPVRCVRSSAVISGSFDTCQLRYPLEAALNSFDRPDRFSRLWADPANQTREGLPRAGHERLRARAAVPHPRAACRVRLQRQFSPPMPMCQILVFFYQSVARFRLYRLRISQVRTRFFSIFRDLQTLVPYQYSSSVPQHFGSRSDRLRFRVEEVNVHLPGSGSELADFQFLFGAAQRLVVVSERRWISSI